MRLSFSTSWAITVSLLATYSATATSQQYITDDASITEYRACQIQLWYGQRSSEALPACTPIRNLEVSVGLIAVWKDEGNGHPEYVAQIKTLLSHPTRALNLGLVVGTGRDPGLAGVRKSDSQVYVYVPVSLSLLKGKLMLHNNVGWLHDDRRGSTDNALTFASRVDVTMRKYFLLIAEAYDAHGQPNEFQAGVRWWTRPGKVQLDLSYGGQLRNGKPGAGWTLGLALTTPPIL